jgi:hypothetical protein
MAGMLAAPAAIAVLIRRPGPSFGPSGSQRLGGALGITPFATQPIRAVLPGHHEGEPNRMPTEFEGKLQFSAGTWQGIQANPTVSSTASRRSPSANRRPDRDVVALPGGSGCATRMAIAKHPGDAATISPRLIGGWVTGGGTGARSGLRSATTMTLLLIYT